MNLDVLDGFPQLVLGAGDHPSEGGCLMQVTSWLWNGDWHDHPECVDKRLISFGIAVNDTVRDEDRNRLLRAVPTVMNTRWLPEGLSDHEQYAAYERIDEWAQTNWPWSVVPLGDCECEAVEITKNGTGIVAKVNAEHRLEWGHDDLYCLVHRMEAVISRAGDHPEAMGGGVMVWTCDDENDVLCQLPNMRHGLRLSGQKSRHAHYTPVPPRVEAHRELVDFFVAFVQEWSDAFAEYAPLPTEHVDRLAPERWGALRQEMTDA